MCNNFSHSAIKKMDFFMSKLRGFDGRGHFRQYQSPLDKKLCIKTNNFKILIKIVFGICFANKKFMTKNIITYFKF